MVSPTVDQSGKKTVMQAVVDTGCDAGLSLTKEQFEGYGVDLGEKLNSDPLPAELADGSIVGYDHYRCEVEVGGERRLVDITVIDPSKRLDVVEETGEAQEEPDRTVLLGRGFMNYFDVHFSGLDNELSFLK